VFTSDNGYHWGEHWVSTKFTGYEEALRVPYLVRYPMRYPVPEDHDAMVLNIDLAPTFAELAGAPVPSSVDGESLLPVLDGSGLGRTDFMFENFMSFVVRPNSGVRTRRWKYIRTDQGPSRKIFEELYDLESDPYELDNLAYSNTRDEILDALAERLLELQAE
jgi:arylsulfatase A-like enzyme